MNLAKFFFIFFIFLGFTGGTSLSFSNCYPGHGKLDESRALRYQLSIITTTTTTTAHGALVQSQSVGSYENGLSIWLIWSGVSSNENTFRLLANREIDCVFGNGM